MKRTPLQAHAARIRGLLARYEALVRLDESKGGGDPDAIPLIEREYAKARRKLLDAIGLLR